MARTEKEREYYRLWRANNREKTRSYGRKWRKAHPEKRNVNERKYYAANASKIRARNVLRDYALDSVGHLALLSKQNFKCAIDTCIRSVDLNSPIDHDKVSLKIRGILCMQHNTGLGHLGDTIESVKAALRYLIKSK